MKKIFTKGQLVSDDEGRLFKVLWSDEKKKVVKRTEMLEEIKGELKSLKEKTQELSSIIKISPGLTGVSSSTS